MRAEEGRSKVMGSVFLVSITGVAFYGLYLLVKPLLSALIMAVLLAILAAPIFHWCTRVVKNRRGLGALLACLIITFIILLPLVTLVVLLAAESITIYGRLSAFLDDGGLQRITGNPALQSARDSLEHYLGLIGGGQIDLKAKAIEQVQALAGFFIGTGQKFATGFAAAVGMFFVMLFSLYFFFLDGPRIVVYIEDLSPLPEAGTRRLLKQFNEVTHAAFLGSLAVAAVQGFLTGVAFAVVGFQGIFWGIVTAFCSLVPVVGSGIIWAPAGLLLLVQGRWVAGILILVWGGVVVSGIDNFLRPWLMGGRSGLHPLIILISVLGGIKQFGMLGIFLGPLTAALGLTMLEMFAEAYGRRDTDPQELEQEQA